MSSHCACCGNPDCTQSDIIGLYIQRLAKAEAENAALVRIKDAASKVTGHGAVTAWEQGYMRDTGSLHATILELDAALQESNDE